MGFDPSEPRDDRGRWTSLTGDLATDRAIAQTQQAHFTAGKRKAQQGNVAEAKRLAESLGQKATIYSKPGSPSAAVYANDQINLNASHKFWQDPAGVSARQEAAHHLASADPRGVVFHETGHALFDPPDNFISNHQREAITQHVSKYAASNPKEFVAEVYSGTLSGKTYPPEIMGMFNVYARKRTK